MGDAPLAPLVFSPDGHWLALESAQGVTLYDARTLDLRLVCPFPLGAVSLAFAPDSATLTAGGIETAVVTWHLPGGELGGVAQLPRPGAQRIAYAPDGSTFAVASAGGVALFRPGEVLPIWTVDGPHGDAADMVFAADGRTIVIADHSSRDPHGSTTMALRWLRVADGATVERREGPIAYHVALSLDTTLLARTYDSDAALELVTLNDGTTGALFMLYPAKRITALDFVLQGTLIAVGDEEGAVTLWDTRTGQPTRRVNVHPSAVVGLAGSPDSVSLATVSAGSTVILTPLAQWR